MKGGKGMLLSSVFGNFGVVEALLPLGYGRAIMLSEISYTTRLEGSLD